MNRDVTCSDRFVRWSGIAGAVGGLLWVTGTVMHASRPVDYVAEECARRPMRESSAVEGVLTLGALLLFGVAAAGLIVLPFGFAWVAVGYAMWGQQRDTQ